MAFYKVTYHEQYRFATVHNFGCTFRCSTCSYKLRSGANGKPGLAYPEPERFLETQEIQDTLRQLAVGKVYFMGGEPTVARDLPEMLRFAKEELGVETRLGHTNGSRLPLPYLDGANVGLKAWDNDLHRALTGREREDIFQNVAAAYGTGIEIKVNVVFIPGLVDLDQVEAIAAWLGAIDRNIPFHIMGYIPVPGQPYSQPSQRQMASSEEVSRRHLNLVAISRLDSAQALNLSDRDDRFAVKRVL
jgi:pyruvate formate lyase activating enzyme